MKISLPMAKPGPGEGTNYWIPMEKEGERGGAAAGMELGNRGMVVWLSDGNLREKVKGTG